MAQASAIKWGMWLMKKKEEEKEKKKNNQYKLKKAMAITIGLTKNSKLENVNNNLTALTICLKCFAFV